jgi:NRPS condensation-like uncharacterized protein
MDRYGDLGMHVVLDLRRAFSRDELARAMQAVIDAFPVLGRCYVPRFWRDAWEPVAGPVTDAVHVEEQPDDLEARTAYWARRVIDSTRERPLRLVSIARGENQTRLILSVMHVAVDGAGAAAVGHVLGSHLYGLPPMARVDSRRTIRSTLEGLRWFHVPVLLRDIAGTGLLPMRILRAARRTRLFPRDDSRTTTWRNVVFSAAEVARIKERCGGVTLNDALIAALARVAKARSSHGDLAVMYTMDLRRYAGAPRLTAANTSSILSIIVPRHAVGDLASTAASVAKLTARQHQSLVGPAFLVMPAALGIGAPHAWIRKMLPLVHSVVVDMPLRRGLVFTNVGRLDHGLAAFGDDIEAIHIIGPNVAGMTTPTVVAFGFRGALHLELFAAPGLAAHALPELEAELREALEL